MARKQFTLRCDEEILIAIKNDAVNEKRSTNLHIEEILQNYIKRKNKKKK